MSSTEDFFAQHFATLPVMAILRGNNPERTVALCEAAWDAGVGLVEATVESPAAFPSLVAAIEAGRSRGAAVGAGTVTTAAQVHAVHEAGAQFLVSPGLHPAVVDAAAEVGLPYLPGVATATEIAAALERGLVWLKAFPAAQLGAGWIKAQLGPFPAPGFVATGGINADNAGDFLTAGCRGVALGSALDPDAIRRLVDGHRSGAAPA